MARKIMAKCFYCGETFDRNAEEFVAVSSRRYAHKHCFEQNQAGLSQEEKDLAALEKYIKQKFSMQTVSAKISKQIANYKRQYQFTYSGMLKALIWWFDVKNHTLEGTNDGVGILPYIYNDAKTYYYGLYVAEKLNQNKTIHTRVEEVEIAPPQVYIQKPRLFNIGEENENEK